MIIHCINAYVLPNREAESFAPQIGRSNQKDCNPKELVNLRVVVFPPAKTCRRKKAPRKLQN
jgi:hypothetical protein